MMHPHGRHNQHHQQAAGPMHQNNTSGMQERISRANSFFRELSTLHIPAVDFNKVGRLNDMQRLL